MEENKNKGGRKSTVASYEERIPQAFEWILYEKINSIEFRERGAKEWGISQRAVDSIWADCKERIKKRFEEESEEILTQQLQRSFDLLKRCRETNNRRVEAEVLRDISKLYGLDTRKIDIQSGGQPISININLTD
jgi:hypothetical protein